VATVERTGSFKELTALRDAERNNESTLNVKTYRDLDLFFTRRSRDSDVNVLTNVTAVKRSVRNLILTNFYEKPFHPEIGSGVRDLLFEIVSPLTAIALAQSVEDVINNYEPRALLLGVDVIDNIDANAYDITVTFEVINAPGEIVQLDVLLEALR
jgi:phage baseplate assembly protein W|tara:strand:+ start:1345 stop:1812 length:468 start_codon:yes stop_codon:yes gene_type:complete